MTAFSLIIVLAFLSFLVWPESGRAAINPQINYQGQLTGSTSVPVSDGNYIMKFRLYTSATGATTTNIWEEIRTATGDRAAVTNGLFSVMLGSSTPLTNVNFNQTLYLGVEVCGTSSLAGCDGEMSPRKILGAVPAAFEAQKLSGLATSSFLRADTTNSTSTTGSFVTINQTGTGNILDLQDGGTTVFTVLDGGNVGIGTSSPYRTFSVSGNGVVAGSMQIGTSSLHQLVVGNSATTTWRYQSSLTLSPTFSVNSDSTNAINTLLRKASDDTTGSLLVLSKSRGTNNLPIAVEDGDDLGAIYAGGYYNIGQGNLAANINFTVDGAVSSTELPSRITFSTTPTGSLTATERLRIDNQGRVGINDSSPHELSMLTVSGTTTDDTGYSVRFQDSGDTELFSLRNDGVGYFSTRLGIATSAPGTTFAVDGTFNVRNAAATSTFEGNGVNLINGGCYAIAGVCVASTATVDGLGFAGMLTSWSDSNTITATSGPTAAYYIATSTTATSTFAGGFAVGGNNLVVDRSSGRVSLATTSTEYNLTIYGDGAPTNIGLITDANSTANQLVFRRGSQSSYVGLTASNQFDLFTQESIPFVFTIGGGTEVMRLDTAGNVIANAGNLGIGTSSPYAKLSVVGQALATYFTATSTTATSTFAGGLTVGSTTIATTSILNVQGNGANATDAIFKMFSASGNVVSEILNNGTQRWYYPGVGRVTINSPVSEPGIVFHDENDLQRSDIRHWDGGGFSFAAHALGTQPSELMVINGVGNVGIASNTPFARLAVTGSSTMTHAFLVADSTDAPMFNVLNNGRVGIATTSPWRTLSVQGTVGFQGLTANTGAGSLCLSSTNEVVYNDASDNCLPSLRETKKDIAALDLSALNMISELESVSFVYKDGNGRTRYGFIAEDVAEISEYLATYNSKGDITGVDDRAIISVLVKGMQELYSSLQNLTGKTISYVTARFENLKASVIEIGSADKPTGITLYDEKTGDPYCLKISGGKTVSAAGKCGNEMPVVENQNNNLVPAPVLEPEPIVNPEPEATSTDPSPEVESAPIPEPEPVVEPDPEPVVEESPAEEPPASEPII